MLKVLIDIDGVCADFIGQLIYLFETEESIHLDIKDFKTFPLKETLGKHYKKAVHFIKIGRASCRERV